MAEDITTRMIAALPAGRVIRDGIVAGHDEALGDDLVAGIAKLFGDAGASLETQLMAVAACVAGAIATYPPEQRDAARYAIGLLIGEMSRMTCAERDAQPNVVGHA
jgi:hypothetical protein